MKNLDQFPISEKDVAMQLGLRDIQIMKLSLYAEVLEQEVAKLTPKEEVVNNGVSTKPSSIPE